ncbi:MAG TPA: cobalamin-independent methionine synthase II family protein [Candidatus Binataceae bacterium]|nr:cobalamin-independent methionine synthase II family protein [Candidatus Binataceae bacterium]
MLASRDRILTTHAGSLPRPPALARMFGQLSRREPVDQAELERAIDEATRRVVRKQIESGIDIGNNGEQPRESFFTYVQHRMSGFGGRSERPRLADVWSYPTFVEAIMQMLRERVQVDLLHAPKAVGEVKYVNREPLERECADYLAIAGSHQPGFAESFMTAPSPGIIAAAMLNDHYGSQGDYLDALGEALRVEYETIVASGMVLQIDAPDLAMEHHVSFAERQLKDFIGFVDSVVAAMNRALTNVPPDRVRLHVCWGNYEGPHDQDVALEAILPSLLQARAGALMLSMANPRHEHEYRVFKRMPLPSSMLLIAGVIDTTTNYIEHPEVVADRLERAAEAIGDPHRVLAGTDCGFETSSGLTPVADEIVWAKLRALRDGAMLASRRMLG